jgi:DNA repair protein RadC
MRKKLISFGSDIFNDHELLEMLLYSAIPCKNTNPVAIELIRRFDGLCGVFSATREELMSVDGIGERAADMILSVGALEMSSAPFEEADKAECFDDYHRTGKYIVDSFDGTMDYKTFLLLLNNSMEYIALFEMTGTDYSSAAVKSSNFLDAALTAGASVAIVAHNHPFGPCVPSFGDLETNSMIRQAFQSAGVILLEHYLVIGERYIGIMDVSKNAFPESSAIQRFVKSKEAEI